MIICSVICSSLAAGQGYFSQYYCSVGAWRSSLTSDTGLVLLSGQDLWKVDKHGNVQWGRELDLPTDQEVRDVAVIEGDRCLVVGRATYQGLNHNDALIYLFSNAGIPIWGGLAGDSYDEEYLFANSAPGGTALIGGFHESMNKGSGHLSRVDTAFGPTFPESAILNGDGPYSVVHDAITLANGDVLACGTSVGEWVIKRNALGTGPFWTRWVTGVNGDGVTRMVAAEAPDGSIYVGANAGKYLLKFAADGTLLWVHRYPSFLDWSGPYGIHVRADSRVVVAFRNRLVQYSPDGTVEWARSTTPRVINDLSGIPGTDIYYLTGYGPGCGWIMRPDTNGQVDGCSFPLVPANFTVETVSIVNSSQNIQVSDPMGVPVMATTSVIPPIQAYLECFSTDVADPVPMPSSAITVSPNPVEDRFRISVEPGHGPVVRVRIVDLQGRLQRTVAVRAGMSMELSVNDLPGGLYTLLIDHDDGHVTSTRIVVL